MVKKFTIPFASQGDANDIPDALQVDGKVSFTQGFGYDYERPYDDPQAKDIAREDMNGLFKAITSAVGELQTLGASEWSSAISYPKGSIVYFEKDLYISQVDDNQSEPPQNWVSITSIANDSLKKAANLSDLTNKATARNNLGLGNSATLNKTDVLGTSTSLVATQKLVNDTKINLENSKQDKLTFVGGGKVMREGAYGLGLVEKERFINDEDNTEPFTGVYQANYRNFASVMRFTRTPGVIMHEFLFSIANDSIEFRRFRASDGGWQPRIEVLTNKHLTQYTGSSTTSVMSQKAVTDLVKINTASKKQNGWWKCGDTGLIYQWGTVDYNSKPPESDVSVNFPISFQSTCLNVSLTRKVLANSPSSSNDGGALLASSSKSNFAVNLANFSLDNHNLRGFTWFAIGY